MGRRKKSSAPVPAAVAASPDRSVSDVDEVPRSPAGSSSCRDKVEELCAEIQRQRDVISVLTTRLNFVLSMFGIDEIPASWQHGEASKCNAQEQATTMPVVAFDRARSALSSDSSPKASFQCAVLSTVFREKQQQENRSKNFVVTGLSPNVHNDDKTSAELLCQNELNLSPEVTSCRRLGKLIPGKVQPLLVSVRTAEQATSIIASARQLRRSSDAFVKANVYINPDLTKAQADAAYQARCHRRQAHAAHNKQSALRVPDPDHRIASHSSSATPGSSLHPATSEFIPSSAAS